MSSTLRRIRQGVQGISIDPAAQIDHEHVTIGSKTEIQAGPAGAPTIEGTEELPTKIGERSVIYGNTIIEPGAIIGNHTAILSSKIGKNAQIGSGSHIAGGAIVGANAHIGQGVEIKSDAIISPNATIDDRAKILEGTTASITPHHYWENPTHFDKNEAYYLTVNINLSDQHLAIKTVAGPAGNHASHTETIPYTDLVAKLEEISEMGLGETPKIGTFNKPKLDEDLVKQETLRYLQDNAAALLENAELHQAAVAEHQASVGVDTTEDASGDFEAA